MKKPQRIFIMVAAGLILTCGFTLATSPSHRPRQRAVRVHTRNSIPTMSFSFNTNALASGQIQAP